MLVNSYLIPSKVSRITHKIHCHKQIKSQQTKKNINLSVDVACFLTDICHLRLVMVDSTLNSF